MFSAMAVEVSCVRTSGNDAWSTEQNSLRIQPSPVGWLWFQTPKRVGRRLYPQATSKRKPLNCVVMTHILQLSNMSHISKSQPIIEGIIQSAAQGQILTLLQTKWGHDHWHQRFLFCGALCLGAACIYIENYAQKTSGTRGGLRQSDSSSVCEEERDHIFAHGKFLVFSKIPKQLLEKLCHFQKLVEWWVVCCVVICFGEPDEQANVELECWSQWRDWRLWYLFIGGRGWKEVCWPKVNCFACLCNMYLFGYTHVVQHVIAKTDP